MHDLPKIDDPLLRAILEMREYVDGLIDQEKRRVGEWAVETARDGDLAATAVVGGQRHEGATSGISIVIALTPPPSLPRVPSSGSSSRTKLRSAGGLLSLALRRFSVVPRPSLPITPARRVAGI